ncbi:MAG: adenine phosphoribosyltransferase [Alphaproteobacteria bacterium]
MIDLKSKIRTIPDYPKPGIMFRDITTLIGDAEAFSACVDQLLGVTDGIPFDHVAGIEARGFIFGGAMAHRLSCGFIPIRKKGKLPWDVISHEYDLEYGTDVVEVHRDAVRSGDRVLLVDDLLATGGTAEAGIALLEKLGGAVVGCGFIVDLPDLGGRRRLEAIGKTVHTLIEFDGE